MDGGQISRWFGQYLEAFALCGKGEADTAVLLRYYGVPLLLTTDDAFFSLTSSSQVVAVLQGQIDGLRAGHYARSQTLSSEVILLNSRSALYKGTFSRQRADGEEINRVSATYLVTEGSEGPRISLLAFQSR